MNLPPLEKAFIGLGSNISPEAHLPQAVQLLELNPSIEVLKVSSVWESAPVGFTDQAPFCNAAVLVQTSLLPKSLKSDVLGTIEQQLGRVRDPLNKNGPRTIDLDISLYGCQVITTEGFVIPDPEIAQRSFLSVPLAELDPQFAHPVLKKSLEQIANESTTSQSLKHRPDIVLCSAASSRSH